MDVKVIDPTIKNCHKINGRFLSVGLMKCYFYPYDPLRDWSKSMGGVGRSRKGVVHEVLSLVQGVGRAIFSYR